MNELLVPISNGQFKNKVDIRFNNILDGFDLFKNFTLKSNNIEDGENKIIEFVERIFEENSNEAYIDFYINKISDEDKEKLISLVPDSDKKILELHLNAKPHNGVFYKLLNKTLIPFLVRLNTREVFFVTFYFVNKPITIWGNYDLKFPCFFNNENDLEFYYRLSKSLSFYD
ncbi:MAG: hypothetical protein LLF98_11770 [Clostridium sp.]|uniref:hypothetical protein n=1 Tax=Clostridium sp. TaxID=1506 RepID=UPI0025B8C741|nr:hypothetical protein [Clostridium sp.]MCE5221907.1 hypothetical protein [Clostridium sp.]